MDVLIAKAGDTSTAKDQSINDTGDGYTANNTIDTKKEAEDAIALLGGNKDLVVVIKSTGEAYDLARLESIRDGKIQLKGSVTGGTGDQGTRGEGVSHGVAVQGGKVWNSHGTKDMSVYYRFTLPFVDKLLAGRFIAGVNVGGGTKDVTTPGGENSKSDFTHAGGILGGEAVFTIPALQDRIALAFGPRLSINSFWTPADETINRPTSCTPIKPDVPSDGNIGRAECEPNAGPTQIPANKLGLEHELRGSVRETSGMAVGLRLPLTVGVTALRGTWGRLEIFGGGERSYKWLFPKDGHGLSLSGWGAFVGTGGDFGGEQAYISGGTTKRPDADNDGVPDGADKCENTPAGTKVDATGCPVDKDNDGIDNDKDACPDSAGVANADPKLNGCPAAPAPVAAMEASVISVPASVKPNEKFPIGVDVKSKSRLDVSVAFVGSDGKITNSSATHVARTGKADFPFDVPPSLKAGKYKLLITFEDPKTGVEKVEEKEVVIVESVTATLPGSFAPGQPPTVQNVKVSGIEKLEGVTYVVEGFDKDNKSVGTASGKNPVSLNEKTGQLIKLDAPGKKGFEKDVTYKVSLKNKDGFEVWSGSFVVGQAAVGGKKVKPK